MRTLIVLLLALGLSVPELAFRIPVGATFVSFYWDHGNFDGPLFNDGMSIDIVDGTGALLFPLVYADGATPAGTGTATECGFSGPERAPDGPNEFSGSFAPALPGSYLSIVIANDGDYFGDPGCAVDNIVTGPRRLRVSQPQGGGERERHFVEAGLVDENKELTTLVGTWAL